MPSPNPFRELLNERNKPAENPFRAAQASRSEAPSANYVAREMAARGAIDSVLAVPSASGGILADSVNAARAMGGQAGRFGLNNMRSLVGMEHKPNPPFGERYADAAANEGATQWLLRGIPRPTVEGITSAIKSAPSLLPGGETPSDAMARNRQEFRSEEAAMREAHPTAAMVGDIGGDALSLLIGRRATGADRWLQRVETRLSGRAATGAAESLASDLSKVLKGPAMQRMARGAGRSVEAGVEAAAMDVLKDPNADPLETAALAAGGQLVGSGFISGTQGLLKGGPTSAGVKITIAAASTWGLLQLLKSATPGGQDRILESIESGYDKVALMMGIGMASAAIGSTRYGRGNTALSDQTRAMLDGIGTVHRGSVLSLLTDWTKGDEPERATIERVLNGIAANPSYKGSTPAEQDIVRRLANERRYHTSGGF